MQLWWCLCTDSIEKQRPLLPALANLCCTGLVLRLVCVSGNELNKQPLHFTAISVAMLRFYTVAAVAAGGASAALSQWRLPHFRLATVGLTALTHW